MEQPHPNPSPDRSSIPDAAPAPPDRPGLLRRWLGTLGPGLTSGASNNDPSAIATYISAGAGLGLALLWAAPLLVPMMMVSVYIAAKLGMVSGQGLAALVRDHFPRPLLYGLMAGLVLANTINAAADLGAVAAGINLLLPLPRWLVLTLVTAGLLWLQIWGSHELINSILKWLTLALFAFVIAAILSKPDWPAVFLHTVVPRFESSPRLISISVAMIGTALSPYLFFWQTGQRVEEEVQMGRRKLWQRRGASDGELAWAARDVNTGMIVAGVIIYSIILATASTLHRAGITEVGSAADAAKALAPLAGRAASALFAAGFIGAGLLAVPVLTTGAAYAVSETFHWNCGLNRRPRSAPRFYLVIALCTLAGLAVNLLGTANIMTMLVWAAVINGLLSPLVLAVMMIASARRSIMGKRVNGWWLKVLGWLTTAATAVPGVWMVAGKR